MPRDIMTLHQCTKNYHHMILGQTDVAWGRWMEEKMKGWKDGPKK